MKRLKGNLQKDISIFLLFSIVTLLFYRNTANAGFTFDFVSWINSLNEEGLIGSTGRYTATGMLPVYHLLLFTLYKLFGLNGTGWYIFSCLTHAFAAYLVLVLVRKILTATNKPNAFSLAFFAALMFLVFPQHTEVLIWRAAIHYQLVAITFLACLILTLHYNQSRKNYLPVVISLLFFTGLFLLEEVLMLPALLFCLIWLSPISVVAPGNRKTLSLRILLPQALLVIVYFVIAHLWIGKSFGHYGGNPMSNLRASLMVGDYFKQVLRIITFHQYTMGEGNVMAHRWLEVPAVAWGLFTVMSIFTLVIAARYKRLGDVSKVMVLFALFFTLVLPPILLVYRDPLFGPENNRYLYFPSLFMIPLIVLVLGAVLSRWRYIPVVVYLGVSAFQLNNTIEDWVEANKVKEGLLNDFRWYGPTKVFILAIPNYLHGIFVFEGGRDFQKAILLYKGKDIFPKTKNMLKYNIFTAHDSLNVGIDSTHTISINDWIPNSWLWYDHVSGDDSETDDYRLTTDGPTCKILIKHPEADAVYIYPVGDKWQQVKFNNAKDNHNTE